MKLPMKDIMQTIAIIIFYESNKLHFYIYQLSMITKAFTLR